MGQQRRSKTTVLLEELSGQITSGALAPGSDFYTMKELMNHYHICLETANQILRELHLRGLIEVQQGRKSKVVKSPAVQPSKPVKPVGVITPVCESFQVARWRDALLQEVQRQLLLRGSQSLWCPKDFCQEQGENYSGIIYTHEQVCPEQWRGMAETGIPCVRISFDRPFYNTVFIDYRPVLDQMILHMAHSACERMIYLSPTREEGIQAAQRFQHYGRIAECLEEYGIPPEDRLCLTVVPSRNLGMAELKDAIGRSDKKIAFVGTCSTYSPALMQIMAGLGRRLHDDYEIYSFSFIESELHVGNRIDLKYPVVAEKLVNMFYRRFLTGKNQLGEVIFAEFIADT